MLQLDIRSARVHGVDVAKDDRHLNDADRRIWRRVSRTVTPKQRLKAPTPPAASREDFAAMMRVPAQRRTERPTPGPLEPTAAKTVRRGRVVIDTRVDLHDLTLAQAYPRLVTSLNRAYDRGHRTVLVITGKGRGGNAVEGWHLGGKIRGALPGWLAGSELRPIVATYAPAHQRHGGLGAWYVFLKRAG